MTKEFEDGEVKQEARDALATAFEGVGGMSKFIAWAKTHRSAFYSMYVKLLPMQVQSTVAVTHRDSDEYLHKLQDAFMRTFASRREDEAAGIFYDDEGALVERGTEQYRLLQARYEIDQEIERVGAGRSPNDAGRQPLEQVTYSRVEDPSPVDAGRATLVNDPPPRADEPSRNQNPNLQADGSPLDGGPSADHKAYAHPINEPSATEKYYEWMEGASRHRWGPI
jgi:hypothetical protein